MKFYIINLKHDKDRKKHMISLCNSLNITPEIINAIYGKELPNVEDYINCNKEISIKRIQRILCPGEIGCIMSHQNIYKKMIEENIQYATVLEDDVDLSEDIKYFTTFDFRTLDFDILLLGYHGTKSREHLNLKGIKVYSVNPNYTIYSLLEIAYGTYGYIVSLEGAKRILKQSLRFDVPIDHYTGNNKINKVLCVYPQLVFINKELSDESILTKERQLLNSKIKFENEFLFLSNNIKNANSQIIIYGFNDLGLLIYENFITKVTTIIDKNKVGQKIDNLIIQSIDNLTNYNEEIFVITAVNNNANKEIRKDIIEKFGDKTKIYSINDYYFDENKDISRYCPICETNHEKFNSFGYNPREDALCPTCGSLERHRLSWLVIKDKIKNKDITNNNLLHIAPEKIFMEKFTNLFKENYLTADLYDKNAKIKMDIKNIEYPNESFDYIYCSHVLEHIQDDKKAMRELNRVLKKDGWAILLVPIMTKGPTEEDHSINTPAERMKHYGHPDHVRNYGCDYKERLEESGWEVEVIYAEDFLTPKKIELMGITKAAGEIYFCTKKR